MRGQFSARALTDAPLDEALRTRALRDGFHPDAAAFDADLSFAPSPDGESVITVQTELGENLLVWAKQLGMIRVKKIG